MRACVCACVRTCVRSCVHVHLSVHVHTFIVTLYQCIVSGNCSPNVSQHAQFQVCIKNNAEEARQLLLQNPQLAYALLQAQVIMRLIDSSVAQEMLHRSGSSRMDQAPPPPSSSRASTGPSDVHKDLPPPPPPHTQPPGGGQPM